MLTYEYLQCQWYHSNLVDMNKCKKQNIEYHHHSNILFQNSDSPSSKVMNTPPIDVPFYLVAVLTPRVSGFNWESTACQPWTISATYTSGPGPVMATRQPGPVQTVSAHGRSRKKLELNWTTRLCWCGGFFTPLDFWINKSFCRTNFLVEKDDFWGQFDFGSL